jgi:hypothetical protein
MTGTNYLYFKQTNPELVVGHVTAPVEDMPEEKTPLVETHQKVFDVQPSQISLPSEDEQEAAVQCKSSEALLPSSPTQDEHGRADILVSQSSSEDADEGAETSLPAETALGVSAVPMPAILGQLEGQAGGQAEGQFEELVEEKPQEPLGLLGERAEQRQEGYAEKHVEKQELAVKAVWDLSESNAPYGLSSQRLVLTTPYFKQANPELHSPPSVEGTLDQEALPVESQREVADLTLSHMSDEVAELLDEDIPDGGASPVDSHKEVADVKPSPPDKELCFIYPENLALRWVPKSAKPVPAPEAASNAEGPSGVVERTRGAEVDTAEIVGGAEVGQGLAMPTRVKPAEVVKRKQWKRWPTLVVAVLTAVAVLITMLMRNRILLPRRDELAPRAVETVPAHAEVEIVPREALFSAAEQIIAESAPEPSPQTVCNRHGTFYQLLEMPRAPTVPREELSSTAERVIVESTPAPPPQPVCNRHGTFQQLLERPGAPSVPRKEVFITAGETVAPQPVSGRNSYLATGRGLPLLAELHPVPVNFSSQFYESSVESYEYPSTLSKWMVYKLLSPGFRLT